MKNNSGREGGGGLLEGGGLFEKGGLTEDSQNVLCQFDPFKAQL